MNDEGWLKLWRQYKRSAEFSHPDTWWIFSWLLGSVNHADGFFRGHAIPAGSIATSPQRIADESPGWDRSKVRRELAKLEQHGSIKIKTTNKFTIITLVNWGRYQHGSGEKRPSNDHQTTNGRPTGDHQATIKRPQSKNEKNEDNKKNGEPTGGGGKGKQDPWRRSFVRVCDLSQKLRDRQGDGRAADRRHLLSHMTDRERAVYDHLGGWKVFSEKSAATNADLKFAFRDAYEASSEGAA